MTSAQKLMTPAARRIALWLCTLVHRQLPSSANFVVTNHVQVAITAPDLEVAIVGAIPLIDVVGYFDPPGIETNSAELFRPLHPYKFPPGPAWTISLPSCATDFAHADAEGG